MKMMKIACLGWGSLVWDPRGLPIEGQWLEDGPLAPVELLRQSDDGRITLVIEPSAMPITLLWANMGSIDLRQAKQALGEREGIPLSLRDSRIGQWQRGGVATDSIQDLPAWAEERNLGAVIWTALGPKFDGRVAKPSLEQVVGYLRGLSGKKRSRAKEYIRCAPRQIDTEYRRGIEASLGWSHQEF
jgi:hypothetical protein